MWRQLEVEAGQRVLEVGTGTGYSTALGAHRLGGDRLTSIEYDSAVGRAAASALAAAGYAPRLVIGDGMRGDPEGGAYDRLIATCSVRYVPMAWLHQVKPGGKILVTLSGWSYASGLAHLTVTGPGTATGRFLPGYTSFMIARPHDRPPRPTPALLPGGERPSRIDPAVIGTWTGGWVAQLAAPAAERMGGGAGTDPLGHLHRLPGSDSTRARWRVDGRAAWSRTAVGPRRDRDPALAGGGRASPGGLRHHRLRRPPAGVDRWRGGAGVGPARVNCRSTP
nr:hypothetical protein [Streptomyces cyaneofuscatus]